MLRWLKALFSMPQPTGPARTLRAFRPGEPTVARDCVRPDQVGWRIDAAGDQSVRLFEVENPGVEQCLLTYRADVKTEGLNGRAYLEMWCRVPGLGEFFSKGLRQTASGTTDWARYEIPFYLKKGQRPDLVKLNLAVQGAGTVWLKNVELLQAPLA